MRRTFVILSAVLALAGCSNSSEQAEPSSPSTKSSTATNSETAATSTPSVTASSTTPPITPTPAPSTVEPSEESSVDYMGRTLEGVPDCNWEELDFTFQGQQFAGEIAHEYADIIRTGFVLENLSGKSCVIREAPQVMLLDSSEQLMSPSFRHTVPQDPLPWVVPHWFMARFYYESPSPSFPSMCPQTAEYVSHIRLEFDDGKVLDYPVDESFYSCPNTDPWMEIDMKMNLAQ
ncbi:hypothetical protein J2S70_001493 [Trueperella bonasi]|uniref:Lipoprotein n=1 Tax=Trueperella bonasi TaxID=312286 RepID=A0ABT9NHN4_9ACTO|nr:membrane lipoprotein lipid attachment site-containing protein [Trueperella bonasi]MDP9806911.1 hypothetical protein [Trueperella bonasi]